MMHDSATQHLDRFVTFHQIRKQHKYQMSCALGHLVSVFRVGGNKIEVRMTSVEGEGISGSGVDQSRTRFGAPNMLIKLIKSKKPSYFRTFRYL